jgi:hypothetical protein
MNLQGIGFKIAKHDVLCRKWKAAIPGRFQLPEELSAPLLHRQPCRQKGNRLSKHSETKFLAACVTLACAGLNPTSMLAVLIGSYLHDPHKDELCKRQSNIKRQIIQHPT